MGLIAIDLDGTLINNQHEISTENINAIKQAQAQGHTVVIGTGRAYFDVQEIFKKTHLSLYIIGANGATAHSPSGTPILSVPMPDEDSERIATWLEANNIYYEVFCEHAIYTLDGSQDILFQEVKDLEHHVSKEEFQFINMHLKKQLSQSGYAFMNSFEEIFQAQEKIYNILAYSFINQKRLAGVDAFKDEKDLTLVTSSPFNFELEHKEASKGNALTYLAKVLNLDLDQSLAIGDSENDISMFKVVSNSFAMDNASEDVKKHAKYVTSSNDENGVAKAIYQFITD